jgi:hypothetical protein
MRRKKTTDRHKKGQAYVRIRPSLTCILRKIAEQRGTDLTEEGNRAVMVMAEREGYIPPSSPQSE